MSDIWDRHWQITLAFMKEWRADWAEGMPATIWSRIFSRFISKIKISKLKIYSTLVFCLCLYECETWPLLLREGRRLRLFENTVLRNMFGRKRGWRGMHGDEVHDLYSSPKIIRVGKIKKNEIGGAHGTYSGRWIAYRVLVGKPEGNISLRRRWVRW